MNTLILFIQVFVKLIRRYKYLERAFEDEMKKVLMYTKGFQPEQRAKLADVTAIFLAQVRDGRWVLLRRRVGYEVLMIRWQLP